MKALKQLRKKSKMTLENVSQKIGITKSSICQHEKGKRTPSITTLKKYAQLYNCTVDDLLKEQL